MHCYADDTQIYLSFKPNPTTSENPALIAIESCVADIRAWLLNNSLLINDSKTEFQVIGTRQQLSKVHLDSLTIVSSRIPPSKEVRNQGAWFDDTLSMSTHVTKVAGSCFYFLYNIRWIRKYLSRQSCEILVNALVTSRLDYCRAGVG